MSGVQAGSDPRGRVVVGVDGTPGSLAALRRAADQARRRGADLHIVYVIPAAANAAAEASGYELLDISVRSAALDGLGAAADRIVARGLPAELLVIGASVRCGQLNLSGGEVVPYCLANSGCPVDICAGQPAHAGRQAAIPFAVRGTGSDLR